MHDVYNVVRGDFSHDMKGDSKAKKRRTLASFFAPDMRTVMQEAARELNTGSMTIALMLSYVDLGTSTAVAKVRDARVSSFELRALMDRNS